jgi:hypothetical protein
MAELSLMAQRGELTESDEVRWSRQRNWRPAAEVDGLLDSEPADPTSPTPAGTPDSGQALGQAEDSSTPNDDDQSPVLELESTDVESGDEASDSTTRDAASATDTVTDFLNETATSATTYQLSEPPIEDAAAAVTDLSNGKEHHGDDGEWRLEDALAEQSHSFKLEETSAPSQVANSLPPLPVPSPLPIPAPLQSTPQPSPQKPTPISMPKLGRSDTILDVVYDNVLEPVFSRVPILANWPGVAAAIAVVALLVFMMIPSYEGANVSGRVTLDGQPLSDATISFTNLKQGFGASAIVGPDGAFEVITLKGGMRPGTYSVAVMPLKPESPKVVGELQRQYSESKNGDMHDEAMMMEEGELGMSQNRPTNESEQEKFQLPPTTIPFQYRSIQTSGISKEIAADRRNDLLIELATN